MKEDTTKLIQNVKGKLYDLDKLNIKIQKLYLRISSPLQTSPQYQSPYSIKHQATLNIILSASTATETFLTL